MDFYRVNNIDTQQGLWYDFKGEFTGLIHNKFNFCKNRDLKMDFDPELVGYISAVDNLEDLYNWFPKEDIYELQKHGFYIHKYQTEDFKFYERFQHTVINQQKSELIELIEL
ncbi:MAG: hypothetical protein CMH22_05815 [Methylophaga sp.]|nr:hypothetical protein [Methylophaga sp.]|tara:strand:+ start:85538 stop:85873 length:336 start_codon:yes stop_codon:yes gene_type:complete